MWSIEMRGLIKRLVPVLAALFLLPVSWGHCFDPGAGGEQKGPGVQAPAKTPAPLKKNAAPKAPTPTPAPKNAAVSPAPAAASALPLYRQHPPEMVIVGEIGDAYILTRKDLELMVGTPVSPALLAKRNEDEFIADEIERQKSKAEEDALWNWALVKTIAVLARKDGMAVTDEELNANLEKLNREMGLRTGESGPYSAQVMDPQKFREEMRDAFLVDKAILSQVEQMFPEEKRQEIYETKRGMFSTPPCMHVWHIYKPIPGVASEEEIKDLRKGFYQARKKAARSDGRDFEKTAREVNPPIGGKPNNGDMGWIDANSTLGAEVMQTLNRLKIGEVSDILLVKGENPFMGRTVLQLLQPGSGARPQFETAGTFHIFRVTEREPAKGLTYDDYARKKVLDNLVEEFKVNMGRIILSGAPFPVRLNATGLRLINEPNKK